MSATLDQIHREVAQAVEQWQPDPDCLAAGDRYIALAVQCWAACLSDHQIAERLRAFAGPAPVDNGHGIAEALVQYAADFAPDHQIMNWLGRLKDIPGWPDRQEALDLVAEVAS